MIKALEDWETIKTGLESLCNNGFEICNLHPKSEEEYEKLKTSYKDWKQEVLDFLRASLDESIGYIETFRLINANKFKIPNSRPQPLEKKVKDLKSDIQHSALVLKKIIDLLGVSEMVTAPQETDWVNRNSYTSQQIINLLLNKLFDLYGDEYYPVKNILQGNGIYLAKRKEEFEYVELLQKKELIESQNTSQVAQAKLTLKGKLDVEEKRRPFEPNYDSISNDQKEISQKIDEVKSKLKELGFGQEVIFNELDDLRELFGSLSKKNWGEIFKGKMLDLLLNQFINEDIANSIFNHITNDILKLNT